MNARSLTGSALKAVLRKAAEAGIGEVVTRNFERLSEAIAAVDDGSSQPSLPAGGRAGEGAFSQVSVLDDVPPAERGGPLPYPPPFGERGAETPRSNFGNGAGLAVSLGARTTRSATLMLAAPDLFAREFGAVAMPAEPLVGPAIDRLRRRRR